MKKLWTAITYAFLVTALLATGALLKDARSSGITATIEVDPPVPAANGNVGWFQQMRAFCNPVEVETRMRRNPHPDTQEGRSQAAACWALAGHIDEARGLIQSMPQNQQWEAASVVFGVGHPVADSGNDIAAGPLMELVVEFWPNNYMALYHAGASRYQLGDSEGAVPYLERFLQEYSRNDGWTRNAKEMLAG